MRPMRAFLTVACLFVGARLGLLNAGAGANSMPVPVQSQFVPGVRIEPSDLEQDNSSSRNRPQIEACRTRPTREEGLVAFSCGESNAQEASIAFENRARYLSDVTLHRDEVKVDAGTTAQPVITADVPDISPEVLAVQAAQAQAVRMRARLEGYGTD